MRVSAQMGRKDWGFTARTYAKKRRFWSNECRIKIRGLEKRSIA